MTPANFVFFNFCSRVPLVNGARILHQVLPRGHPGGGSGTQWSEGETSPTKTSYIILPLFQITSHLNFARRLLLALRPADEIS